LKHIDTASANLYGSRISPEVLASQRELLLSGSDLHPITSGIREGLLILNSDLQILFANQAFLAMSGTASETSLLGIRIGEALSCVNSDPAAGGCGSSDECAACRVLSALGRPGIPAEKESATIYRTNSETLHLKVGATAFTRGSVEFLSVTLLRVNPEERRAALERIFYHDILNSAGVLKGLLELLHQHYRETDGADDPEAAEIWRASLLSSARIVEEIQAQRDVSRAERGELSINPGPVETGALVDELRSWFAAFELAAEGRIVKSSSFVSLSLISDPVILRRVMINLIKNAVEGSPRHAEIVIDSQETGSGVRLSVRNEGVIPEDIRQRLFRQTFSTKGKGRGFGTYSIKLLTEQYLHGKVGFVSSEEEQTIFHLQLPKRLPL
jgi:signal transduction histidine kinase